MVSEFVIHRIKRQPELDKNTIKLYFDFNKIHREWINKLQYKNL